MRKIGLDLDKTITATPWLFSALTQGLVKNGHQVHIITYRNQELLDYTRTQLIELGISYTELHLPPDKKIKPEIWKAQIAKRLNIEVMFDDQLPVLNAMTKTTTFWIAEPNSPDVVTCLHALNRYDEFRRLDDHLGLPLGTIVTVIKHRIPDRLPEVREALAEHDIKIDDRCFIPKKDREKWYRLLEESGMDEKWLNDHGFSRSIMEKALAEIG
jgi:hypothetical protein